MTRKRGLKIKQAQAAMEFLMVYGWAILIVFIVLGILFYLGLFTPRIPSNCIANAPLACSDFKGVDGGVGIDDDFITIVIGASAVENAEIDTAAEGTMSGLEIVTPQGVTGCTPPIDTSVSISSTQARTWSNCNGLTKNSKVSGTIAVKYIIKQSTETHIGKIQFSGQIE